MQISYPAGMGSASESASGLACKPELSPDQ